MSDPAGGGREPDILDIIAAETAQITDEHIEERLQETLRRAGYAPADDPMDPALLLAYQAVFTAIADGWNRKAARLLRDLTPENLAELHVICGDVQTMVEAEERRRGDPEGSG